MRSETRGQASCRSSALTGRPSLRQAYVPASRSPTACAGCLLEILLDDPRRVVDADEVAASRAEVDELVRRVGPDDEDVAVAGLDVLSVGGEPRPPGADDPGLRVGVPVQRGPLAR